MERENEATSTSRRRFIQAAAMLTVGFASVMASEFVTLQEFGALTAGTMGLCALTDLTLLPALLVRTRV